MADEERLEAIYSGLQAIVDSIDRAPAKERDNYAPMAFADQFNKLRDAAVPLVKHADLLPSPIPKSAMVSSSTARYLDMRAYAVQVRDALPYVPQYGGGAA